MLDAHWSELSAKRKAASNSPFPPAGLKPVENLPQQQGEEQGLIPAGIVRSQQVSRAARGVGMRKFIAALCSSDNGGRQAYDPAANGRGSAGTRSGLDSAQQMLSDKLREDSGRVTEYEYQRQRSAGRAGTCRVAELPENEARNRYPDVLPYDETRVRLKQGTNSYINASLLSSRDGESPSWQFIVAQGPLDCTAEHMWQMAWEQQCSMLVMLTRCTENRVTKCTPYFPEAAGASSTHGRFTIRTTAVQELDADIRVRDLVVTCADEPESAHYVQHYHYHAWPDHSVPRHTASLRRLAQTLDTQSLRTGSEFCAPPLVHCSAGIGRSGALCTVAVAIKRLRAVDPRDGAAARQAVNVKRIVGALRRQRAGMVQTYEQYLLCYQAIKEELDEMLGNTAYGSSLRRQSQRV